MIFDICIFALMFGLCKFLLWIFFRLLCCRPSSIGMSGDGKENKYHHHPFKCKVVSYLGNSVQWHGISEFGQSKIGNFNFYTTCLYFVQYSEHRNFFQLSSDFFSYSWVIEQMNRFVSDLRKSSVLWNSWCTFLRKMEQKCWNLDTRRSWRHFCETRCDAESLTSAVPGFVVTRIP